jgi:hypothetical protein
MFFFKIRLPQVQLLPTGTGYKPYQLGMESILRNLFLFWSQKRRFISEDIVRKNAGIVAKLSKTIRLGHVYFPAVFWGRKDQIDSD